MKSSVSVQAKINKPKARKAPKFVPKRYRPRRVQNNVPFEFNNASIVRFKGSELVYTMGALPTVNDITSIITSNPRYNTAAIRLYNMARGYQQWRPIALSLEWVPTCPTTSTGMVTMGTNWNTTVPAASAQSSLIASNGGVAGAVYSKLFSKPDLRGRMSQRWYYFNSMDEDSNPFSFAVINNLASSGFFRLHYDYQFSNPTTQLYNYTVTIGSQAINTKSDSTIVTLLQDVVMQTGGVDRTLSAYSNLLCDKIYKGEVLTNIIRFAGDVYEFKDGVSYNAITGRSLFRS